MHPIRSAVIAALAVLAIAAGCARGVAVQSEPGPAYSLEIVNTLPQPMIVSFDDGRGSRLLGTVPASGQATFLVTGPASTTITVTALDQAGTVTIERQAKLRVVIPTRVTLSS